MSINYKRFGEGCLKEVWKVFKEALNIALSEDNSIFLSFVQVIEFNLYTIIRDILDIVNHPSVAIYTHRHDATSKNYYL